MVVVKQQAPTPSDTDAIRLEAIRMRVLSQEWADTSVVELMQALAKLHALPPTIPTDQYQSQISVILVLLDRFAAAAKAASTFNNVIEEERSQIATQITRGQQQILQEEKGVRRLREKLEREKIQVDRRAQYDALAKLILDCPPCEKSQKQLEEAQKEARIVTEDIKRLEDTKEVVRKELLLLAHSAAGVERSTRTLSALISDQSNHRNEASDAMDTSI